MVFDTYVHVYEGKLKSSLASRSLRADDSLLRVKQGNRSRLHAG